MDDENPISIHSDEITLPEKLSSFFVSKDESAQRLDKLLATKFPDQSRSYFQMLLDEGLILLNGQSVKKRTVPKAGDEIEIQWICTPELTLTPEPIPLKILYEDDFILAIDKPVGMVVHPAVGNWSGTFVNALIYHCKQLQSANETLRPGIVHRLDKNTSGILLAAKTTAAQQKLIEQFAKREMHKEYLAICHGNPGSGVIDRPIGRHPVHRQKMAVCTDSSGRHAETAYETLASKQGISLVSLKPKTGRTHQIRVHLQALKAPVLGDTVYGSDSVAERYHTKRHLLHARRLKFLHPITRVPVEIEAPLPEDFISWIQTFGTAIL